MILNITTPAVLFSTVSLLMSTYNTRFLSIAKLVRDLSLKIKNGDQKQEGCYKQQIYILSKRIAYIKYLHFFGVLSLFCSTSAMFLLLFKEFMIAKILFIVAIILFLLVILVAIIEIYYSMKALDIELKV